MGKRVLFILVMAALLVSACGGSDAGESSAAGSGVRSLEEAQSAVIQIEAQGSFLDPEVGMVYNAAGRGSGFIIDPSGIAVTNNHVVTGAALIQVWIGGDDEPHNARILGVSECSDLAVIDIEGEGFPYLDWYDGDITVGMDVYAAGFPLGDPEFTLTRGIIAKASADGETPWSSVDHVIMHDATINPGNSGGPLITTDGQLVGINYMGSQQVNQYFAISRDEALRVIDTLRESEDYLSIGINGQAVRSESLSGIWVSSVQSGSPADISGIQAGDIILTIEDLVLSTDGTMADYCDILRTHNPGDTLDIQVLRYADQIILEGQINGRELASQVSLVQPTQPPPTQAPAPTSPPSSGGSSSSGGATSGFVHAYGVEDSFMLDIPNTWQDIISAYWEDDTTRYGVLMYTSSDLEQFFDYAEPGSAIYLTDQVGHIGTITDWSDAWRNHLSEDCSYIERADYANNYWSGILDYYTGCGSRNNFLYLITLESLNYPGGAYAQIRFLGEGESDLEILATMLVSLAITGDIP